MQEEGVAIRIGRFAMSQSRTTMMGPMFVSGLSQSAQHM